MATGREQPARVSVQAVKAIPIANTARQPEGRTPTRACVLPIDPRPEAGRSVAARKVSPADIKLFPHPKADRLQLAPVEMFELVIDRGSGHQTSDVVVFAPKRSRLLPALRSDYINPETGILSN